MTTRARISMLATLLVAGLLIASPTATALQRLRAALDIERVGFTDAGEVKVRGTYLCPPGFEAQGALDASGYVSQQLPHRFLESVSESYDVSCGGGEAPFSLTFQGDRFGEAFRPGFPILATVNLWVTNAKGGSVSAHREVTTLGNDRLADIEVEDAGFIASGAVKVTGSYTCADGYDVDSTFGLLSQLTGPSGKYLTRRFDRKVTCDGTWNDLAVRFLKSFKGQPFDPGAKVSVQLSLSVVDPEGHYAQTSEQQTRII